MQLSFLYIKKTPEKGRGVFTLAPISKGTLIEIAPVIVLPIDDRKKIDATYLYNYYFLWHEGNTHAAIALGNVSIYNHDSNANCIYETYYDEEEIHIIAHRDIAAGEELTINYNGEPDNQDKVWFEK